MLLLNVILLLMVFTTPPFCLFFLANVVSVLMYLTTHIEMVSKIFPAMGLHWECVLLPRPPQPPPPPPPAPVAAASSNTVDAANNDSSAVAAAASSSSSSSSSSGPSSSSSSSNPSGNPNALPGDPNYRRGRGVRGGSASQRHRQRIRDIAEQLFPGTSRQQYAIYPSPHHHHAHRHRHRGSHEWYPDPEFSDGEDDDSGGWVSMAGNPASGPVPPAPPAALSPGPGGPDWKVSSFSFHFNSSLFNHVV
jgi:hypothetical protein